MPHKYELWPELKMSRMELLNELDCCEEALWEEQQKNHELRKALEEISESNYQNSLQNQKLTAVIDKHKPLIEGADTRRQNVSKRQTAILDIFVKFLQKGISQASAATHTNNYLVSNGLRTQPYKNNTAKKKFRVSLLSDNQITKLKNTKKLTSSVQSLVNQEIINRNL